MYSDVLLTLWFSEICSKPGAKVWTVKGAEAKGRKDVRKHQADPPYWKLRATPPATLSATLWMPLCAESKDPPFPGPPSPPNKKIENKPKKSFGINKTMQKQSQNKAKMVQTK
jgi:hypothetical protein